MVSSQLMDMSAAFNVMDSMVIILKLKTIDGFGLDDYTNVIMADYEWYLEGVMYVCFRHYHCYFRIQRLKLNPTSLLLSLVITFFQGAPITTKQGLL